MEVILLSIILKCNAHTGRCTFLFLSPPPLTKTFFVNFLEVTKEKRIFAAAVPKEECVISGMTCPLFSLLQPLLSANSATSFCKLSHFILQTNPSHSAYEFESSSQRSHIFEPTKSYLQASAIESSSQRSRMYRLNETYELAQ